MFRLIVTSLFVLLLPVSSFALSFHLDKAPLTDLVTWVSETTERNILFSDECETSITLDVQEIAVSEVWEFFESVLIVNGYGLTQKGKFWLVSRGQSPAVVASVGSLDFAKAEIVGMLGEKDYEKFQYKVYSLQNVDIKSVYPALTAFLLSFPQLMNVSQFVSINGFGVSGDDFDLASIDSFVQAIDKIYPQIIVEAIITEVVQGKTYDEGLDVQFSSGQHSVISSLFSGVSDLSNLPSGLVGALFRAGDYRAVVRLLETSDLTRLLSTPRIVVNDGEQGEVFVGENVPFVTGQSTSTVSDTENPFQMIQRVDVGVKLMVRPSMLPSGLVRLEVRQEASSVTDSTLASDIITNQRHIYTTVNIRPGEILCLGGLTADDSRRSIQGVPYLSKIPYLGRLFGGRRDSKQQRTLNVFLRVTLA